MENERLPIGVVDRKFGVIYLGNCMQIPIPESLAGAPDQALVYATPAGILAWEYDGKLVTRFDHVNKKTD